MNLTALVGRLTKDVDLRYTPNGVAVANFTVAVNRPFKNEQGESEADFINCVIWRKPAENLATYTKKGSQVSVTGAIQTRTYENQEGKTVYVTEVLANSVQFLDPKGSNTNDTSNNNQSNTNYQEAAKNLYKGPSDNLGTPIDDSSLPF